MRFGRRVLTAAIAAGGLSAGLVTPIGVASASIVSATGTIPLLRVGTNFPEPTLNSAKNPYASWITAPALETLLKQVGANNELRPNLATSWAQTGPDTYVYHLRHGVRFWDGDEMTAADVAFSYNYWRSLGSTVAYQFAGVKSITATGPFTVLVTLTQPNAAWQYAPAQEPGIFEMKFFEAHKATFGNAGTLIMGTGPWELDSFDPTTGAEMSANPHWWGGKVPIQHISVKVFSNETSLELAMRAGEIDLDPYILDTKAFASASGATLLTAPSCSLGVFSMNTQTAPWSDIHVRRAVAYALDRSDIITAAGGYNTPIYTYIPPSAFLELAPASQVNSLMGSLPLYKYNMAKAKAEMAQSVYPNGYANAAVMYEYNYGSSINISEVIAAELQKIGINAQVKVAPTNAAWQADAVGPANKRSTIFSTGWCPGPDISSYGFSLGSWNLKQGEWNDADWAPPAVDSLLKAGVATVNKAKRFAVYSGLIRTIQEDLPYIGLYQESSSVAVSKSFGVPGFNTNSMSGAYALNLKPVS
jgi:peptide/nickel transport system substrate-binding protein